MCIAIPALLAARLAAGLLVSQSVGAKGTELSLRETTPNKIQINLVGDAALAEDFDSLLLEWLGEDQSKAEIRRIPVLRSSEVLASSTERQLLRIWVVLDNAHLARVYLRNLSQVDFRFAT